jgi:amidase
LRFGANLFLGDSIYKQSINTIIISWAVQVEYEPEPMSFGFGTIPTTDMKVDLPNYLNTYASNEVMRSIAEIVAYNN